jgi:hypothetical protein
MELRFRTTQLDDGKIRIEAITNPWPGMTAAWENFETCASIEEAAEVCGEEVAIQLRRELLEDAKVLLTIPIELRVSVLPQYADAARNYVAEVIAHGTVRDAIEIALANSKPQGHYEEGEEPSIDTFYVREES